MFYTQDGSHQHASISLYILLFYFILFHLT